MSEDWSLPGYDVQALLGFGATGEVWRARERATGETVALKRLRDEVDPTVLQALRDLRTPYAVRVRDVVRSGTETVLVLDHAGGGSLATLLARRGPLEPGEVVTIGSPLAQALAVAHRRGLVHGDLTPAGVLFTSDGMPLLSDLGLVRSAADATDDVRALAELCRSLLADPATAPPALVAAIEAGLAEDPASRPDAAAFAERLRRAHRPEPVRLSGPPRPAAACMVPAGRRRLPQGALLAGALGVLLLAGGTAGWVSGRAGDDVPVLPVAAAPPAAQPAWAQVLDELDAARAQAFSTGDLDALTAVHAPGSPGLAADTALLRQLVDRGETAHGLRHAIRAVEVLEGAPERARLRVVDTLAAYEIRDLAGDLVSRAAARGERAFLVELARTPAGWRLVEVRPEQVRP